MSQPAAFTPTVERLNALRDEVAPGPVVMLNLLKFNAPDGLAAFGRYGAITAPLIEAAAAKVLYAGQAGPAIASHESGDWDMVILVEFPSIDAFVTMVGGDTYQNEAAPIRPEALERTLWMVSQPTPGA